MSLLSTQSNRIRRVIFDYEKPTTYFNLIEQVGDQGKYQKQMMLVFSLCWFVTGIILLSNVFLFRNRIYDCQQNGMLLEDEECLQYICNNLPEDGRDEFVSKDHNQFKNIATLNNYECEDSLPSIIAGTCAYAGAMVGLLVVTFMADNYGRKLSLIVSWGICVFGSLLVIMNENIISVSIGLFLSGFGSDASCNITFLFFCETLNNKKRQKYSIIVQIFFTLGALVGTSFFYLINDWRIIWGVLVVFISIVQFLLLFCYVEQTPHFLLKKGNSHALNALNRIGLINRQRRETLELQDLQNVFEYQQIQKYKNLSITHLDLCRFGSLRKKSILCSLVAFAIFGMYYGPALIADNIGINIYATLYMVLASELVIFIPTYVFIEKIQRKKFGIVLLSIAVLCSFVFSFIQDPSVCGLCLESTAEIIFIIIFRAATTFFFNFFQIYICQIFPARVRGLSFGIISSIGSLSSTFTPIMLNLFIDSSINPMIIFTVTGGIAIGCLILLPETMGIPLHEEIEELRKDKKRYPELNIQITSSLVSKKSSIVDGQMPTSPKIKSRRRNSKSGRW